jgi:hypothetical protein
LLTAFACVQPNYYQQRINDIPTVEPNFGAKIRFAGDSLPLKPFFEVIDFELVEKGRLSRDEVKSKLEIEAIKEGVDAVIEVDTWNESGEVANFFTVLLDIIEDDGEITTIPTNYTIIKGRGIVYLESLDNIHKKKEYEYFYELDPISGFPEPFFKIEFKLTGQEYMVYPESAQALDIYKKYFQFYSDFHLLIQRERWVYLTENLKIKKRILKNENGYTLKICIPEYDGSNRVTRLKIVHRNSNIDKTERVNYSYNDSGMITARLIEVHDGSTIFEEYQYFQGQLEGRTIRIKRPDRKPIKLQTSVHYYEKDYLEDYYFNEVVNKSQK